MAARGWLDAGDLARGAGGARRRPAGARPAFGAPHFVAGLVSGGARRACSPGCSDALAERPPLIAACVDDRRRPAARRRSAGRGDRGRARAGKGVTAASAVVVDNATGDVLAYVGLARRLRRRATGARTTARAPQRQPGSTLKPFLYELAMEKLGFDPATLLPDVELHVPVEGGRRLRAARLRRPLSRPGAAPRGARQLAQRARPCGPSSRSASTRCSSACASSASRRSTRTRPTTARASPSATVR